MKKLLFLIFFSFVCLLLSGWIISAESATPMTTGNLAKLMQGAIPFTNTVTRVYLNGNTPQYVSVPAGANLVLMSCSSGVDYWVQPNITSGLAVPTATDAAAGVYAEQNPSMRQVQGATVLGVIADSAGTTKCSFGWYQ